MVTTLPVGITLEGEYHLYNQKVIRSELKCRNLELARKRKRYPLYIFLPSGGSGGLSDLSWYCTWGSGDCAEASGVCTGIVGTMFMCICHLYLKHLEHVSRYLGLCKDSWNCAEILGDCVEDTWNCAGRLGDCIRILGILVLWYLTQ